MHRRLAGKGRPRADASRSHERVDSRDLGVTDHATVYTAAVINGQRKVIQNHADAGATSLWAVEQLVDKLLLEAKWDEKQRRRADPPAGQERAHGDGGGGESARDAPVERRVP